MNIINKIREYKRECEKAYETEKQDDPLDHGLLSRLQGNIEACQHILTSGLGLAPNIIAGLIECCTTDELYSIRALMLDEIDARQQKALSKIKGIQS